MKSRARHTLSHNVLFVLALSGSLAASQCDIPRGQHLVVMLLFYGIDYNTLPKEQPHKVINSIGNVHVAWICSSVMLSEVWKQK